MRTFVVTRNIGGDLIPTYIEAKGVGKDLNSRSYRKQFSHYKRALDNLIITDYVETTRGWLTPPALSAIV